MSRKMFGLACMLFLLLTAQLAFASESANTKYGLVKIKRLNQSERAILIDSKVLLKKEADLDINNIFNINSDVAILISSDKGNPGDVSTYFFVILKSKSKHIISEELAPVTGRINAKQVKDKIILDLGYENRKHVVATLYNGKITVKKSASKSKHISKEECSYLYNNIYLEYVKDKNCKIRPEEISGMATEREYQRFSHDPSLNLRLFQKISKESCLTGKTISNEEFKKKVCSM